MFLLCVWYPPFLPAWVELGYMYPSRKKLSRRWKGRVYMACTDRIRAIIIYFSNIASDNSLNISQLINWCVTCGRAPSIVVQHLGQQPWRFPSRKCSIVRQELLIQRSRKQTPGPRSTIKWPSRHHCATQMWVSHSYSQQESPKAELLLTAQTGRRDIHRRPIPGHLSRQTVPWARLRRSS